MGRFLQMETDSVEDGPMYLIEREEKLAQVSCIAAVVDHCICAPVRRRANVDHRGEVTEIDPAALRTGNVDRAGGRPPGPAVGRLLGLQSEDVVDHKEREIPVL